jgi:hypothetical protein
MIEDTLARHFHADALPAGHPVREACDELRRLRAERDALVAERNIFARELRLVDPETICGLVRALRAERDNARERVDRAVKILIGIHSTLNPPLIKTGDQTLVFTHDAVGRLQKLSDAIRAIPDRLDALAKEPK